MLARVFLRLGKNAGDKIASGTWIGEWDVLCRGEVGKDAV
jgi:hypothetical protein